MARIRFTVYNNRDNIEELVLRDRVGALVTDLSSTTRVVVVVGGTEIDSAVDAAAIWWTDSETRAVQVSGEDVSFTGDVLKLQLGHAGLTAGKYTGCCLLLFDANDNDDGSIYADDMEVTVKDLCPLAEDA